MVRFAWPGSWTFLMFVRDFPGFCGGFSDFCRGLSSLRQTWSIKSLQGNSGTGSGDSRELATKNKPGETSQFGKPPGVHAWKWNHLSFWRF